MDYLTSEKYGPKRGNVERYSIFIDAIIGLKVKGKIFFTLKDGTETVFKDHISRMP